MPGEPLRERVPENVSGQIESLVAGDGPYEDVTETALMASEDLGVGDKSPGEIERERVAETSGLQSQIDQLNDIISAIAVPPREPILIDEAQDGFFARITASAADGTNRFSYTFVEVYKSAAGYGGWSTLSGGRSGTARNLIEDANDAVAETVLGNGLLVSHLDTDEWTFEFQEFPNGFPFRMWTVTLSDGTVEYWFQYENGVDGVCDV